MLKLRLNVSRRVRKHWRLWSATHLGRADVVMLGDSLTQEGFWDDYFPHSYPINLGVGGDTTQDVIDRLGVVYGLRPVRLFLLIGINDLNRGIAPERIVANYATIVEKLRQHLPDTLVFLQSVLPVSRRWPMVDTTTVARLNEDIRALANRCEMTFVDLHSHFRDANGELQPALTRDGLHLSRSGYELWRALILPLLTGGQPDGPA